MSSTLAGNLAGLLELDYSLSEVFALEFTVPLWTALGESLFGRKPDTQENDGDCIRVARCCHHCSTDTRCHKYWRYYRIVCSFLLRAVAHRPTKSLAVPKPADHPVLHVFNSTADRLGSVLQRGKHLSIRISLAVARRLVCTISSLLFDQSHEERREVTLVMILDFRLPVIAVVGISV